MPLYDEVFMAKLLTNPRGPRFPRPIGIMGRHGRLLDLYSEDGVIYCEEWCVASQEGVHYKRMDDE